MNLRTLAIVALLITVFILATILSICGSRSGQSAPVYVNLFANPTSGISPAEFSIQLSAYSPSPIKSLSIYLDDERNKIFEKELKGHEKAQDATVEENGFLISITSEGRYVSVSFRYSFTFQGEIAKIFSFIASVENEERGVGRGKTDVVVYSNQPCSVRIYIASPAGVQIGSPPFHVQIGASVTDDRCGTFDHLIGTTCKFKFIWDADNKGHEFSPDGETEQPSFNFSYKEFGIYTPKVVVVDDGGNTCENQNIEPIYVLRKLEKYTFFPKEIFRPLIRTKFLNPVTKILISRPDHGIFEYDVGSDGRFILRSITSTVASDIHIGEDFVLVGSGTTVKVLPIGSSTVDWNKARAEITRLYDRIDSVTFPNRITFFVFFVGNRVLFCPYSPPEFLGDTGCSSLEVSPGFSNVYALYPDHDALKIYLAIYQRETNFKVSLYSLSVTYSLLEDEKKLWFVNLKDLKRSEIQLEHLPSRFLFLKDTDGRLYLIISTSDPIRSAGYRSYIFDVFSCLAETCRPISATDIRMPEVIKDIPDTEICVLLDPQKSYNLNVFDMVLGENLSLCGGKKFCIFSSLCLDEVGGRSCKKTSYYPFLFSNGELRKNPFTNCILFDFGGRNLASAKWDNVISYSDGYIFSSKLSRNKIEVVDSESFNVEPINVSGFQTDKWISLSIGGRGGIDFARFSNDGVLQGYEFHLYVKPEPQDVLTGDLTYAYDLIVHPDYAVIDHFYDGNALIALLQHPGCGERFNFSGVFVYDMRDLEKRKERRYTIYRRYNDIGIHSVSHFDVKKLSENKYKIGVVGMRCQELGQELILFDLDGFNLQESSRLRIEEPIVDIKIHSDDVVYVSTTTNIMKVERDRITRQSGKEGGGLIYIYRGYLFEFISQGPYIKIKIFDGELNKVKDQTIYFGIHPIVSEVLITRAIDEVLGTGQDLDVAILSLSAPTPQMRVSAMIVFFLTDFLNFGKDLEILGISPNFGVATSDVKFFRGSKNLIFLVDLSSKGIFLTSLR